ncbi:phosphoribosyltransferase family protein [Salegentibacter sp. F188]|uniref:Phosphoribosyltransferase family protein n=1 Tax=Autumnicola patrickiae TaxID=3075591 RepID=A0ABU3E449_9FLAO|nr:phosphoribosyltransferase family protein [Salegentibacter sp. F188]MDT0690768.1 phosphoribosyltransferase family protein [Salegentibacter sp. F188]
MFHDLVSLFYPRACNCCSIELARNEHTVCTSCLHELPVTNYHLYNENPAKKVFYGRAEIENATSLLFFRKKGMVQSLIHNLKYRGNEEISAFLGEWMGTELAEIEKYQSMDSVIPVPLHKNKLRSRGFNQVEGFARKIAEKLDAEFIDDVLVKKSPGNTQALRNRLSRWGNMEETFLVENPEKIKNKNVLLVDDIITTGATLEACIEKLKQVGGVKVSIATMAITN